MDHSSARRFPDSSGAQASVGILNGFGRTLGDGIIGLQALRVALHLGVLTSPPVLFRLPDLPAMVQAIYRDCDFAEVCTLPWEFSPRQRVFEPGHRSLAQLIDLRDFAFDRDFLQSSMIDFFLRRLGVSPQAVPSPWRRNTWLKPRVATVAPEFPPGYVLVCPRASMALRNMPEPIHAHIVRQALAIGPVATQGAAPEGSRALASGPYDTLEALCGSVRHAKLVITTDTAMVHLADAFDVPCLAFFPTHHPAWRVRDYPRCMPIALRSELPRGLEFARGPDDEAMARVSWFPFGDDLTWLDNAITRAGESLACCAD